MGVQGIVADGTGLHPAPAFLEVLGICKVGGGAALSQGVALATQGSASCALPIHG